MSFRPSVNIVAGTQGHLLFFCISAQFMSLSSALQSRINSALRQEEKGDDISC